MSSATNLLPNIMAMEEGVWRSIGKFAARRKKKERKDSRDEAEPSYGTMTESPPAHTGHVAKPFPEKSYVY